MRGNTIMTKDQEGKKRHLNKKEDLNIDRGLELMLQAGRKPSKKKTFQYKKILKILNRSFYINFEMLIEKTMQKHSRENAHASSSFNFRNINFYNVFLRRIYNWLAGKRLSK